MSDPTYLLILFSSLFCPTRACSKQYEFLVYLLMHDELIYYLYIHLYCFLSYEVLQEDISYALSMSMFGKPNTALTSDSISLIIFFSQVILY